MFEPEPVDLVGAAWKKEKVMSGAPKGTILELFSVSLYQASQRPI